MKREEVHPTIRRPMTPARRKRIWLAHDKRCGECRVPVPLKGTTIDHRITVFDGGSDEDDSGNLRPLCPPCDKPKTATDATNRAKTKRRKAKAEGTFERKGPRLRSRGFPPGARPIQKAKHPWRRKP